MPTKPDPSLFLTVPSEAAADRAMAHISPSGHHLGAWTVAVAAGMPTARRDAVLQRGGRAADAPEFSCRIGCFRTDDLPSPKDRATSWRDIMPRQSACIELEAPLPAVIWTAEEVPDDSQRWLVLIGDASDAEQTLNFLHDLWPDVDCDTAALCDAAHVRQ